jgi:lipopolysaccharide transport system permease protein
MTSSFLENQVVRLEAGGAGQSYWADVLRYRELFAVLAGRDIAVRYKQTAIGILWAVLRPLLTMTVFTFVFGRIAKLPSDGAPYALLVFSGMVPWFFFASSVSESSGSLVANANLLSKVYFPRILIPLSSILVAVVDFLIAMCLLIILMVFYGFLPSWRLLTLPLFLTIALGAAIGLGLSFSALNIRYRDFQFIVPFFLQMGIYASPIGFSITVVPEKWHLLYAFNPMVGVIEGFRWAVLGGAFELRWDVVAVSGCVAVMLLSVGVVFFRRFERGIADVI